MMLTRLNTFRISKIKFLYTSSVVLLCMILLWPGDKASLGLRKKKVTLYFALLSSTLLMTKLELKYPLGQRMILISLMSLVQEKHFSQKAKVMNAFKYELDMIVLPS